MAVTKELIISASIEILNRDGVENLTMRTLAKELNIKAASLYWHFIGKQELFGEIAEHMCIKALFPSDAGDAKTFVKEICKAYRAMLLTVRDSITVFEESLPSTPRRMEIIRSQSKTMLRMNIKEEHLMTAANMLNNFVLSFVADELRFKNLSPEQISIMSEQLSPEDYMIFANIGNFDENFDYGLRVLFTGLETVDGE
jgi:AcrR family transcriptional regulator